MELVFTLLVVVLLVVLPIALFLLAMGALVYSIYRAIVGDKEEDKHSTQAKNVPAGTRGGARIPPSKVSQADGIKGI